MAPLRTAPGINRGDHVITCRRCAKDNQDHYKFCLGCGAKLDAQPAAAPTAIETAPTAPPEHARPAGGMAPTMVASVQAAPARSMPTPSPVSQPTPSPIVASSAQFAARPVQSAPVAAAAAIPAAAMPAGFSPCPSCGKPVALGFAFCGGCGHRMKPAAATGSDSQGDAGAAKTMFLASPNVKSAPRGHLTLIRPDGTEGGLHPLHEGENLIGRGQGSLFDADPYLSPRHAEFILGDDGLVVQDLRSLNGVFVKLTEDERLESGDIFRIGQELLRFDVIASPTPLEDGTEIVGTPNPGYWGRISVIVGRESDGPAYPLFDESVIMGRERGDILFPEDGYVSGAHAQVTLREGNAYLSDLGSSNGTFFRIRGPHTVPAGGLVLMGQQLFRASYR